jgi:hypothetical protein
VQAVTSMNGGGGALAFRPTWLRLDEAVEILVERGVASELAKASLRRAIESGQRVRATGGFEPCSGQLRFSVHGDIRQSVGTKWLAQPKLNFSTSKIKVLSGGDPGSSDEFEIKPRWQLIEIWAGDIEHLWPVPSAISEGSGATVGHENAAIKALASHFEPQESRVRPPNRAERAPTAERAPPTKATRQPQRERARRALDALFGGNVPDAAMLSNKLLEDRVNKWLTKECHLLPVGQRTIRRAAGRK